MSSFLILVTLGLADSVLASAHSSHLLLIWDFCFRICFFFLFGSNNVASRKNKMKDCFLS